MLIGNVILLKSWRLFTVCKSCIAWSFPLKHIRILSYAFMQCRRTAVAFL